MSDGTQSPKFGQFHPLDKEVAVDEEVGAINMIGTKTNVLQICFLDRKRQPIFEIGNDDMVDGEEGFLHEIEENEQIVGIHGVFNY